MTIKQKIENLTFADLVKKLKEILLNFLTKFESFTGRISTLESNSVTTSNVTNSVLNPTLATYASNVAAVTGGLPVGRMYKTATGEIRIVV